MESKAVKGLGNSVVEASRDLAYLLSRGYRREPAVRFVGDRYRLDKGERLLLYRTVYDVKTGEAHRRKVVSVEAMRGKILSIDGYNVLITVEIILMGLPVFLSDDGVVRDISMVSRKYSFTDTTFEALNLILSELKELKPHGVYWFLDAPIPRSGELAKVIREGLREHGLEGVAIMVKTADKVTLLKGDVVAGSDCVVVEKAIMVVEIPRCIALKKGIVMNTP